MFEKNVNTFVQGLGYVSKANILNRTLGDVLCENTELDILQKWVTLQPDIQYNPQVKNFKVF